jgi:hypothetical protein
MVTTRRPRNMEKTDQKEVEYMRQEVMLNAHKPKKELWIDTRLSEKEMDFLWGCISEENKENHSKNLAGNISKSELIVDKNNWFYETTLKKLTERIFYRDWDNFSKYHIEVEEGVSLPEFEMDRFWVNYQKKHEFNPIHFHNGGRGYSFVVFMKIPTHWEEQHALSISANSTAPFASDFQFITSIEGEVVETNFPLSSDNEGRMLIFPAWVKHQVYPFYECEEERITISGNIDFVGPNRPTEEQEISVSEYEEKENMLKIMENSVKVTKEELKMMKKGFSI